MVPCSGYYQYKTFKYGCHEHSTPYNVSIGLMHSCNSYFFSMVRALIEKEGFNNPDKGLNILANHLYDFGLGNKLGIDLFSESPGSVPTSDYYKYLYRAEQGKWYSTYIMSIGIGQGELELTTLQMANLAAIIANRGWYYTPHLVKGFSNSDTAIDEKYKVKRRVRIDQEHFEPVIDGMHKTITRGTGIKLMLEVLIFVGKREHQKTLKKTERIILFSLPLRQKMIPKLHWLSMLKMLVLVVILQLLLPVL